MTDALRTGAYNVYLTERTSVLQNLQRSLMRPQHRLATLSNNAALGGRRPCQPRAVPEDAAAEITPPLQLQPEQGPRREQYLTLSTGEKVALSPRRRSELWPCYEFSREEALRQQLEALRRNNEPYVDHGVEVLYRFADFDPFQRCNYFGRNLDLGQWERFRRVMHTPAYSTLLEHRSATLLSSVEVSETVWKARVEVVGAEGLDLNIYEVTMNQRLGGMYDGFWYCSSLICDGNDWSMLRITAL